MVKLRKLFFAASLACCSLQAFAQIGEQHQNLAIGFNGGVNFNNATFQYKIKQQTMAGLTGGITVRYISEKYFAMICGAQVELNYSQRGWSELFETTDTNGQTIKDNTRSYVRKMNYIDIPFLAHLAFGKDRGLQFFINAGPQIGFLFSEKISINPPMNQWVFTPTQQAVFKHYADNKFDYGIAGGLGLELKTSKLGSFLIEGRYYFALSDFMNTTKKDYFSRAAHSTLTAKVTYLFDLKK